jgi:hypothetical protein
LSRQIGQKQVIPNARGCGHFGYIPCSVAFDHLIH